MVKPNKDLSKPLKVGCRYLIGDRYGKNPFSVLIVELTSTHIHWKHHGGSFAWVSRQAFVTGEYCYNDYTVIEKLKPLQPIPDESRQ